jgi:CheY-like chemotaxis protein
MVQSALQFAHEAAIPRILVVEDEPLIRFTVAEALRELGIAVIEAATADEAWQYLTSGGGVDLVLTDHRMPGSMLGAELATRIQREFPGVSVVVTSAYLERGEWPGPFLAKPYNIFKAAAELAGKAFEKRRKEEGR